VSTAAQANYGLASLNTSWYAVASTVAVNVLENTGLDANDTTTPFFNVQGNLLAVGVTVPITGLFGGLNTVLRNPILTALGTPSTSFVWTGTDAYGNTSIDPLGPGGSPETGEIGYAGHVTDGWVDFAANLQVLPEAVYGISGVLTVPPPANPTPVPEPPPVALLMTASLFSALLYRKCAL
jgi:hypothetical protein